jgi:hypothetical protein
MGILHTKIKNQKPKKQIKSADIWYFFITHFRFPHSFPVSLLISGFVEILKKYDINEFKEIYS